MFYLKKLEACKDIKTEKGFKHTNNCKVIIIINITCLLLTYIMLTLNDF